MNNSKARQQLRDNFVLAVLVAAIWTSLCAAKRIMPFGPVSMSTGDMLEESIALYTHVWDFLHGNKSLLFDWQTGLGNNLTGSIWHFGLFSPSILFFYLVPRSGIEASMFWYILTKLILISGAMRFVLKRMFPELSSFILLIGSLTYTLSPFVLGYYYFPSWYDAVFLFPLVMYFYHELMTRRKFIGFGITLALFIMTGLQMSWMMVLMLAFLTGLTIVTRRESSRNLVLLILISALAALIAGVIGVPGTIQILSSQRADVGGGLDRIFKSIWIFMPQKWFMICGTSLPIAAYTLSRKRLDKNTVHFYDGVLLCMFLPLILESSNMLWAGGSYNSYPIRYGFMLTYWAVAAGCTGLGKLKENHLKTPTEPVTSFRTKRRMRLVLIWITGIISLLLLIFKITSQARSFTGILTTFLMVWICGALMLWETLGRGNQVSLSGNTRKLLKVITMVLTIVTSFCIGLGSLKTVDYKGENYVSLGNEIFHNRQQLVDHPLERMKIDTVRISNNLPLVSGISGVENYLASENNQQIDELQSLGYSKVGNRMMGIGGTILSDALLGERYTICETKQVKNLTEREIFRVGDFSVCENTFRYPLGILVDSEKLKEYGEWNISQERRSAFERQKELFKLITGQDLIRIFTSESGKMNVKTKGEELVYIYLPESARIRQISVENATTKEMNHIRLHKSGWENGSYLLGIYKDANLIIRAEGQRASEGLQAAAISPVQFQQAQPASVDIQDISFSLHGLHMTVNSESDGVLFLPIFSNKGWKAHVNGEKSQVGDDLGIGMTLPLQKGNSEIDLSFTPSGLGIGVVASIFGMIIFGGMVAREKVVRELQINAATVKIAKYVTILAFVFMALLLYFIPFMYLLRFLVTGR